MLLQERGIILIPVILPNNRYLPLNNRTILPKYTHSKLVLHVYERKEEDSLKRWPDWRNKLNKKAACRLNSWTCGATFVPKPTVWRKSWNHPHYCRTGKPHALPEHCGSSASKLIRKAPCPVITIEYADIAMAANIFFYPMTFRPETREKVDIAIGLPNILVPVYVFLACLTLMTVNTKTTCLHTLIRWNSLLKARA